MYFAVSSLLVVGASEYAQEFIDDQVNMSTAQQQPPPPVSCCLTSVPRPSAQTSFPAYFGSYDRRHHSADLTFVHGRAACGPSLGDVSRRPLTSKTAPCRHSYAVDRYVGCPAKRGSTVSTRVASLLSAIP